METLVLLYITPPYQLLLLGFAFFKCMTSKGNVIPIQAGWMTLCKKANYLQLQVAVDGNYLHLHSIP